jgi:hypothetical protein
MEGPMNLASSAIGPFSAIERTNATKHEARGVVKGAERRGWLAIRKETPAERVIKARQYLLPSPITSEIYISR